MPTPAIRPTANGGGSRRPRGRVQGLLDALLAIACAGAWLSLGGRLHWTLELLTHFFWHYAAACVVLLLVSWTRPRRHWVGVAALATLVLCGVKLWPLVAPPPPPPASGTPIRVTTLNVYTANQLYEEVLALVRREDPDVLVLLETDRVWVEQMAPLHDRYPTRRLAPEYNNFGLAVYSRLPATSVRVQKFGRAVVPSVVAELETADGPLTLVATHPLPPVSASNAELRNGQLAAIAAFAAGADGPVVVAGDLNITPFSPYFSDLMAEGGLLDSGQGRGFQPTWGVGWVGFGLPIDHVLHSRELSATRRRVGPDVGSDHRSVTVDLTLAGRPRN